MFLLLFSLLYNNCCISIFKCNIFGWFCLNLWCIFKNVYCFRAGFFFQFFSSFVHIIRNETCGGRFLSLKRRKIWRKCALMHLEWVGTRDCVFFFGCMIEIDYKHRAKSKCSFYSLFGQLKWKEYQTFLNCSWCRLTLWNLIVSFQQHWRFYFRLYSSYFGVNNRMWINNGIVRALDEWTRAFKVNRTHELWNF